MIRYWRLAREILDTPLKAIEIPGYGCEPDLRIACELAGYVTGLLYLDIAAMTELPERRAELLPTVRGFIAEDARQVIDARAVTVLPRDYPSRVEPFEEPEVLKFASAM